MPEDYPPGLTSLGRATPGLAGAMLATNPDPKPMALPPPKPSRNAIRAAGLDVSVLTWELGGDRPLFLLHGFLDQAISFQPLVESLDAGGFGGATVFAPDMRGHGHSGHVPPGAAYHFPDYLLDLAHVLDATVGERPVDLLGHSMGGSMAVYFAGAFSERVRRLVLVEGLGPPAVGYDEGPPQMRRFVDQTRAAEARPPRTMKDVAAAAERLRAFNHRLPEPLSLDLARAGTREVADGVVWRHDPRHRAPLAYPFTLARFLPFLEAITCPVLLVEGAEAGRAPDVPERAAHLKDARTVVLEGAGHMVHHDVPDALAEAVADFLRDDPHAG